MSEDGASGIEWPSLDFDMDAGFDSDLEALDGVTDPFGPEFDRLMEEVESLGMGGF